jgi:tetratricopeptide (TPR) repeat protein
LTIPPTSAYSFAMRKNNRVLVVSQDAKLVAKLGRFLIKRGLNAEVASDAATAHGSLTSRGADVLLVDLQLPFDTAAELRRSAKELSSSCSVVALVPKKAPTPMDLTPYDACLKKPFSGREILECIQQFLVKPAPPSDVEVFTGGGSYQTYEKRHTEPTRPAQDVIVVGVGNPRTVMHNVGTLEASPFPALLYKMFANQATGILTLHGQAIDRAVYFVRGEPVHAVSESSSESLGAILMDLEIVDIDELTDALDDRRQGESASQTVLRRGVVTPDQLLLALERQVYERTLACCALKSGTYVFSDDAEWTTETNEFPQNPIQLISDGVDRYVGPSVLAPQLGPHLGHYVVRTEKFAWFEPHFPVADHNKEVLELIDGTRTIESLAAEVGGDLMPLMRIVWALRLADMVEFLEEPRTSAERSAHKPPIPTRPPTTQDLSREVVERALKLMGRKDGRPEPSPAHVASEKVLSWYLRLRYDDIFRLLGVSRTASLQDVEAAFEVAMADVPAADDVHLPPPLQEKVLAVHDALRAAFTTLSSSGARSAYLAKLEARDAAAAGMRQYRADAAAVRVEKSKQLSDGRNEVSAVFDLWALDPTLAFEPMGDPAVQHDTEIEAQGNRAHVLALRGRQFAAREQWREACQEVTAALELDPDNPETNILHAWVIYNLPYRDQLAQYAACRSRIELQLERNDCAPDGYYYIARMSEDIRNIAEAAEFYRSTLTLDPDHIGAQEGLERVRSHPSLGQAAPDREDGGLLGALRSLFNRG